MDSTSGSAAARSLRSAADRLLARVSHWNPSRWSRPATAGGTRADAFHALVQRLADLGAAAEGRAPRPVPRLENDLALPDQLRVMVDDLIVAASPEHLAEAAAALDRSGFHENVRS